MEAAGALIEEQSRTLTALAGVLETTRYALAPSPLLVEIEAEQADLSAVTKKSKPDARKALIIPQKNLIHAVNAVLAALDRKNAGEGEPRRDGKVVTYDEDLSVNAVSKAFTWTP